MSEQQPEERTRVSGRPDAMGPFPDPLSALSRRKGTDESGEAAIAAEMKRNRMIGQRANQRVSTRRGAEVTLASGRPTDPMFYWEQNNLPYKTDTADGLRDARKYCRALYQTHPIVASAIDIYTKYPLTGMEIRSKDSAITDFYTQHFFEDLGYEDYLQQVGREHWIAGEAWPLGTWNEDLGVWEDDELINPDDVDVTRSPFLKEPRFQMALPPVIRNIITTRSPAWEYKQLMSAYPELANFSGEDARLPISNVLLKQIAFRADTFNPRGIPIMLRGFRAVMQEEMLNAAQDAVASRLYTPLILAKLGASASDLGTSQPWIPTDDDLADFEGALDAALSGDFRVLIHHFAVSMQPVFGRETMPNLNNDFDRLTDRILQVFGLSRTMLTGAEAGKTYASDSINRDLVSQLLSSYQKQMKRFFADRARVVAEAQEHYDYEIRGGRRYPIMEERLETDPETGMRRIVEKPKLLVPELHIKAMNLKDEADQRQFYEALRAAGVPISMKSRMVNVPIDLDEEIDLVREEQIRLAVEAQETRKATFEALRSKGLPIPEDLVKDFVYKAQTGEDAAGMVASPASPDGEQVLPSVGTQQVSDSALVPSPAEVGQQISDQNAEAGVPDEAGAAQQGGGAPLRPKNRALDLVRNHPSESDDQRSTMPKPASLLAQDEHGVYTEYLHQPTASVEGEAPESPTWVRVAVQQADHGTSLLDGPRHLGASRLRQFRSPDGTLLPLPQDEPSA